MTMPARRPATYDEFALESGRYQLLGAWRGTQTVRVPPFQELELELGGLWAR
jgi:hypothetical protein